MLGSTFSSQSKIKPVHGLAEPVIYKHISCSMADGALSQILAPGFLRMRQIVALERRNIPPQGFGLSSLIPSQMAPVARTAPFCLRASPFLSWWKDSCDYGLERCCGLGRRDLQMFLISQQTLASKHSLELVNLASGYLIYKGSPWERKRSHCQARTATSIPSQCGGWGRRLFSSRSCFWTIKQTQGQSWRFSETISK